MKTFKDFIDENEPSKEESYFLLVIDPNQPDGIQVLEEGRWITGNSERNIRIDQATHGVGQAHAHVHDRKGRQLVVVNKNGTASHGTSHKLNKKDAEALQRLDWEIPDNRLIECDLVNLSLSGGQLLLGSAD